jgi:hypothetical protein
MYSDEFKIFSEYTDKYHEDLVMIAQQINANTKMQIQICNALESIAIALENNNNLELFKLAPEDGEEFIHFIEAFKDKSNLIDIILSKDD